MRVIFFHQEDELADRWLAIVPRVGDLVQINAEKIWLVESVLWLFHSPHLARAHIELTDI